VKKAHLLTLLCLVLICWQCAGEPNPGNANHQFEFSLPDLDGNVHSLSDYGGRILVLNFWATWCPPCLEEMTKLNELYERYKSHGLEVVGIDLDKDSLDLVAPFVKENRIKYTILLGDQEALNHLKNFKGLPTTLVFDRKGEIRKKFDGSFEEQEMEETLQPLLGD
jgi:thiol-disulfide isomerase/thioredoxin